MGYEIDSEGYERVKRKLAGLFDGFAPELQRAGEAGAEAIVRTTLAGIGELDQPFAPYSAAYQAQLETVGGKPQGTVNLRGVFKHDDRKLPQPKRGESDAEFDQRMIRKGANRRGMVSVAFTDGRGRSVRFNAGTAETRPARGVNDPQSDMSLDRIAIEVSDTTLMLIHTASGDVNYMKLHNDGAGDLPQRKWFTAHKQAVWGGMVAEVRVGLNARVQWFNNH